MTICKSLKTYENWAWLLIRVSVGATFIAHGMQKWAIWSAPAGQLWSMTTIMKILSIAEPLGGLGLILGILTPWAALGLVIIMLGALYSKITGNVLFTGGRGVGWEFDLLLLASNLLIMISDGGKYVLEKLWTKESD